MNAIDSNRNNWELGLHITKVYYHSYDIENKRFELCLFVPAQHYRLPSVVV